MYNRTGRGLALAALAFAVGCASLESATFMEGDDAQVEAMPSAEEMAFQPFVIRVKTAGTDRWKEFERSLMETVYLKLSKSPGITITKEPDAGDGAEYVLTAKITNASSGGVSSSQEFRRSPTTGAVVGTDYHYEVDIAVSGSIELRNAKTGANKSVAFSKQKHARKTRSQPGFGSSGVRDLLKHEIQTQIGYKMESIHGTFAMVAYITEMKGGQAFAKLNRGSNQGLKKGDMLFVTSFDTGPDPVTGRAGIGRSLGGWLKVAEVSEDECWAGVSRQAKPNVLIGRRVASAAVQ